MARHVVHYDHARASDPQPGFRAGDAARIELSAEMEVLSHQHVALPPNSLHALYGHGVVDALARLAFAIGPLAPGRDAVLRPTALSDASRILYEADRKTYGGTWEFRVTPSAPDADYRIVIDNREYQRTLSRLQYLVVMASREGHTLRLRL